ncbi:MAG: alternative ribosome rescue aminoacyl-tRNA hydrolase ArfB [Acidimicrobiales bacterium]|nr:alternative ribosome rescue aminoacyl-tRNA hydrolase ArfB [Acidimicrobiales bacterium]MDP6298236.1 alternative ribosome rescue aminoacyl-tRNA hydrolase ArfB [Acidimicrobiales bacterium]HJM29040.1 alternative ribosome rescue aminoacyl-tRNA hydrolase ArfB [Acidimicrobiales bacterium]HJM98383.1 alternative ribosome rescue aminoacyl-tRNA hydrolase ArfB [Acidimicrobiales bacterium]
MRRRTFEISENELSFRFSTSGGPGGQHANKSNTRVELVWDVSETTSFSAGEKEVLKERLGSTVRIVVNETRSQTRNREVARERLLQKVEESLQKRPKRKPTKPTRASKKRRLEDKKRRGDLKRQRRTPRSRDL